MTNNVLGQLIDEVIKAASISGDVEIENEEIGLVVAANWVKASDDPTMSELSITVFQNGLACLIYKEPGTRKRR